jgi:hypothetical protein
MKRDVVASVRKQTLGSLNPRPLEPFLPNNWEKSLITGGKHEQNI